MNNGKNLKTKSIEVATLNDAMSLFYGNQSEAARALGLSRITIATYIKSSKLVQIFRDQNGDVVAVEFINKK
jgi:DNA-binding protein Fis